MHWAAVLLYLAKMARADEPDQVCTREVGVVSGPMFMTKRAAFSGCQAYCRSKLGKEWEFADDWEQLGRCGEEHCSECYCHKTTCPLREDPAPAPVCKKQTRNVDTSPKMMGNNSEAQAKCGSYCKTMGSEWTFTGGWWQNGNRTGSICTCQRTVCTDPVTPPPTPPPTTPAEPACHTVTKGVYVRTLQDNSDAQRSCPGYCHSKLGSDWTFTGQWWQNVQPDGRPSGSVCACTKETCDIPVDPTPDPSPAPECQEVTRDIFTRTMMDNGDAQASCPGYCKSQLGDDWYFTGQWHQNYNCATESTLRPDHHKVGFPGEGGGSNCYGSFCLCGTKQCPDSYSLQPYQKQCATVLEIPPFQLKHHALIDAKQGVCPAFCEKSLGLEFAKETYARNHGAGFACVCEPKGGCRAKAVEKLAHRLKGSVAKE